MFDNVGAQPPDRPGDDRHLRPPRPVWIDLPALFTAGEARFPEGWDTGHRVPGALHCWGRASDNTWIALVHYRLARADGSAGSMMLTHWLPAGMVRPRSLY